MKIKTGDKVYVIAGKDKGKTGKVMQVFPKYNKLIIEGINIRVKHLRRPKGSTEKGQKIEYPGPIDASNVQIVCPKTNKFSKVGYKVTTSPENVRNKVRIAKISGEVLD